MKTLRLSQLLVRLTLAAGPVAAQPASLSTPAVQAPASETRAATGASSAPATARPVGGIGPGPGGNSAIPRPNEQPSLRLNFRGAPLEAVLKYLSQSAGLIINLETTVSGRVEVWSDQPLTLDEAVNLLDTVLHQNGYAAIRNGRVLTIVSRDSARRRDIPVRVGNKPEDIPKNDRMVTQIIPIRHANALAITSNLQPLLPEFATLTANESGNALVLTDVQSDIRRMAEIVKALDNSISGIASIRVFTLRFADAKDLVNVIKELFPSSTNTGRGGTPNPMPMMFGGGPGGSPGDGPGGPGFGAGAGGGGGQTSGGSEARQAAARVIAVADERTNSLLVGAAEDLMPTLERLVKQIDTNAESLTVVRLFPLKNSDPVELADLLSSVFPDDTKSNGNQSVPQFGGPPGGFPGGPPGMGPSADSGMGGPTTSSRARLRSRVTSVADRRTSSLLVTAANDVMPQIERMIAQLDARPDKKQKVFVYTLQNASPNNVQGILQDMFASTSQARNSANQNSDALSTRQTQGAAAVGQSLIQQTTTTGRNAFGGGGQ